MGWTALRTAPRRWRRPWQRWEAGETDCANAGEPLSNAGLLQQPPLVAKPAGWGEERATGATDASDENPERETQGAKRENDSAVLALLPHSQDQWAMSEVRKNERFFESAGEKSMYDCNIVPTSLPAHQIIGVMREG